MPHGLSIKFKVGVIYADDYDLWLVSGEASIGCHITSGRDAITFEKKIDGYLPGPLHTFVVEVNTKELTSTELVFMFDIAYSEYYGDGYSLNDNIYKSWCIIECGVVQLLEVPLLSFRDVVEDFESKDIESFENGDEDYKSSDKESGDKS